MDPKEQNPSVPEFEPAVPLNLEEWPFSKIAHVLTILHVSLSLFDTTASVWQREKADEKFPTFAPFLRELQGLIKTYRHLIKATPSETSRWETKEVFSAIIFKLEEIKDALLHLPKEKQKHPAIQALAKTCVYIFSTMAGYTLFFDHLQNIILRSPVRRLTRLSPSPHARQALTAQYILIERDEGIEVRARLSDGRTQTVPRFFLPHPPLPAKRMLAYMWELCNELHLTVSFELPREENEALGLFVRRTDEAYTRWLLQQQPTS